MRALYNRGFIPAGANGPQRVFLFHQPGLEADKERQNVHLLARVKAQKGPARANRSSS